MGSPAALPRHRSRRRVDARAFFKLQSFNSFLCRFASLDVLEHFPPLDTSLIICLGRQKSTRAGPPSLQSRPEAQRQTNRRQGARRSRTPAARFGERARLPPQSPLAQWRPGWRGRTPGSPARIVAPPISSAPRRSRATRCVPPPAPGRGRCPQSSPRPAAWTHYPAGTRLVDPGGHTLPSAPDPLGSLLRVRARLCARACSRAPSYLPREVTIRTHPGQRKVWIRWSPHS